MAPRKNLKNSATENKIREKSPKKTTKKEKTVLKVPSVITISIPPRRRSLDVSDATKQVDLNTKIALADEARSQLLKEPIEVRPEKTPAKRGRKKKVVVSPYFANGPATKPKAKPKTPAAKKTTTKKTTAEKPTPAKKTPGTRKRVADSTVQKPKIKRPRLNKAVETDQEEANEPSNTTEKTTPTSVKVTKVDTAREPSNNLEHNSVVTSTPSRIRRINRGKRINVRETTPQRPVLPKSPKRIALTTKSTKNVSDSNAGQVNSRKTSTSSTSTLSWTRDISSSSTTTCFTVCSNDFVRFDKKLPVLELTNIDREVNKYKKSNADDKSSTDSSSDSETEQTSDNGSSVFNTPLKVKSPNLSVSSRNSVPRSQAQKNADSNQTDFGKTAKNLLQALKMIDLEFINWLHDTEYVTTDLNKIKDKLFDILNNEFHALTHCRSLQQLSHCDTSVQLNAIASDETHDKNNTVFEIDNVRIERNIENNNNKNENHSKDIIENTRHESNRFKVYRVENNTETNRTDSDRTDTRLENNAEPQNIENNNLDRPGNEQVTDKIVENRIENDTIENNTTNMTDTNKHEISKRTESTYNDSTRRYRNDSFTSNDSEDEHVKIAPEYDFAKPSTSGVISNKSRKSSCRFSSESEANNDCEEDFTRDVAVQNFSQSPNDDDDALSLYAESFTGLESSRINASIISAPIEKPQIEEYIPKPVTKSPQIYSYYPTKSTVFEQVNNGIVKTVCEKQNADSTSINKTPNTIPPLFRQIPYTNNVVESNQEMEKPFADVPPSFIKPRYIEDYKLPNENSYLFRPYCFYNIVNRCKSVILNQPCRYPHEIPDVNEISRKLCRMHDNVFVKEYIPVRRNPILRRRYGICFIHECAKRQLTRILVEMAYDFITRGSQGVQIDETLKTTAAEVTLLHLNSVELSVCEDLLMLNVGAEELLCEALMRIMTCTQNFSRFKPVFLSLTYFMVNNDRTFSLEVAEQILERVCILPFDEPVVRALIQIMRLTDPHIFLNSMIGHFEKSISEHQEVFELYTSLKREIDFSKLGRQEEPVQSVERQQLMRSPSFIQPLIQSPKFTSTMIQPLEQNRLLPQVFIQTGDQARPEMREVAPLPPSPDTTHLDMNKPSEEFTVPKITRTIWASSTNTAGLSPASSIEDSAPAPNFHNWRNRSIFQHINRTSYSPRPIRPVKHMPRGTAQRNRPFTQRLVTIGRSPITYPPPSKDY
ncbi:uncharacterized protein LOC142981498 isoform X2 [Anticarsia gemmatalis]|uniref:uncharacterized protein LOC142981498 isoform X2 n=1 Tax=Anticarsia gemmatalis TaxID=129554 RepID=UPI003F762CD9